MCIVLSNYAKITQKLRTNYTQITHKLRINYANYAEITQKLRKSGRGTGAQIASRLSVVFLVFSVNAGKTKDIPKLVGQLPSAAPSFNCKLHRFNMREKTHD